MTRPVRSAPGPRRGFPRRAGCRLATALSLLCPLPAGVASAEPPSEVAVIVHRENPLSELSRVELERLFLLRRQRWPDGRRIYLLMQEEGSVEKRIVLDRIYRMSSDELKRFWLGKIYRGELTSFPKTMSSGASVRRFVGRIPNAIGYIDAEEVDDSVKVLRIDGRLPGSGDYLLRSGEERH